MALAQLQTGEPAFAEDIRLIIWDLDETFWDGTLTEGGITYRPDHHALVIELARRGIMSAICSKNVHQAVEAELRESGLWDYFIYPSIDWTPKGPRIRAMLDRIGLRPASVLFLDDNPMNRAQAAQMNPGLNVGAPALIADLAELPQLRGKPDPGLTRLAQYRVQQEKAQAEIAMGGDTIAFLRGSDVRVHLDYDVEAHLDRAVELINRTNQLNFTKERLPEDAVAAREALGRLLARNTTDAALIRLRDSFGDYGYVGFYLTERMNNQRRLRHFCFSCRALNMYLEHWTYAHLGRPVLNIAGEVLTDPVGDPVKVDWITPVSAPDLLSETPATPLRFDRIVARGGCDLASLMHYFNLHTDCVIEEFNQPKNGQMLRRDHSAFLMPALDRSMTPEEQEALSLLGYEPADFQTRLFEQPWGNTLYLLSFWADADIPLYRHQDSVLRLPYWLIGAQNHDLIAQDELRRAVATTDVQRERLEQLCQCFDHEGLLSQPEMESRYARIVDALPQDAPVVLMLANERGPLHFQDPARLPHPHHQRLNAALCRVAEGRDNVILLDPMAHIGDADDLIDLNHFKRPVYHALYREVIARLSEVAEPERGAA